MGLRAWASGSRLPIAATIVGAVVVAGGVGVALTRGGPLPSFQAQACAVDPVLMQRIQRGYFAEHSGQISVLPRYPAYVGTAEGGWSHSGPWDYLQDIPIVFYGPGQIEPRGDIERSVTMADVAPTVMTLMHSSIRTQDGRRMEEVARFEPKLLKRDPPRLVLVVVWDGGGWNVLQQHPDSWPHLKSLMEGGVSYTNATVGSSPSVTPSVHTTLGTGEFPWIHGITGIPLRDENGEIVDSFLKGESSRFIEIPTFAERWDEHTGNRARVGMVGYEPWHLGMIGQGSEDRTGDRDTAVWLDTKTNEWITNPDHYRIPAMFREELGLGADLARLDAADGEVDQSWEDKHILDDTARVEETPAFITYHGRTLIKLIRDEGYGRDATTDLLFTNFKQIDRVGHYFNMASEEVRQSIVESDRQLGHIVESLDESVGRGRWVVVVTADHGQQPDAKVVDGYGIDPKEVKHDIDEEFGPITHAVWPTEVFLQEDELAKREVTVEEVARFLGDYRLNDNTQRPDILVAGAGRFGPRDRLYSMAIPSRMLSDLDCGGGEAPPSPR